MRNQPFGELARRLLSRFFMNLSITGLVTAALLFCASGADATTIASLWNTPSRFTAAEAAVVLRRDAEGDAVSQRDLFEAKKYLRTDGGVSASSYVVTDVLTRLLADRVSGGFHTRVRTLPPILHWLETAIAPDVLRLRGETVQIAVLQSEPDRAATVLYHQTGVEEWRLCGGEPCVTHVRAPLRSDASYQLSVPSFSTSFDDGFWSDVLFASPLNGFVRFSSATLRPAAFDAGFACDPPSHGPVTSVRSPLALSFRHAVDWTMDGDANRVLCAFRVDGGSPHARVTYRVGDRVATPPASAARSAAVNNPLDFTLSEPLR